MAFEFTDANFDEQTNSGVAVVDFWAEWCGPCRMVGPIIEELATDYKGVVNVGKMDVDTHSAVPSRFGVRSIPTILIMKNGEIFDKVVGFASKTALDQKIKAALA
jgi:thioredoxin 1